MSAQPLPKMQRRGASRAASRRRRWQTFCTSVDYDAGMITISSMFPREARDWRRKHATPGTE